MKKNNLREMVSNMNAEINISNVILETDRLILRTWEITDLDDFKEKSTLMLLKNNQEFKIKVNNQKMLNKKKFIATFSVVYFIKNLNTGG